jgi:squalene synthase HpnD
MSVSDASIDEAGKPPVAAKSSFYTAMRILPAKQRDGMYAVYAFCRAVDDIADDGTRTRAERIADLNQWRADIEQLYATGRETDLTKGLAEPVREFDLAKQDFLAVIDGMEMDAVRDITAPDWAALDLYCDRVASAVGRLSAKIFGLDDASGHELSHHLGRALQLTNILRDIDEDAEMGRLYLPREELEAAGIAHGDLKAVLTNRNLQEVCRKVAERARAHFEAADKVMDRCPRRAVKSPRIMGSAYRGIFDKLVARGWSLPREKVRTPKGRVLIAALKYGIL